MNKWRTAATPKTQEWQVEEESECPTANFDGAGDRVSEGERVPPASRTFGNTFWHFITLRISDDGKLHQEAVESLFRRAALDRWYVRCWTGPVQQNSHRGRN